MVICDWVMIFEIEPAIASIFELPIGTELTLECDGSQKYFINSETGEKFVFIKLFDNLKNNVKLNLDMLYKDYWK